MTRSAIGTLRHRLALQMPVDTPDGSGGATRTWTTLAELWAAIEPRAVEAASLGETPGQRASHRLTVRWRADIDTSRRFAKGARIFRVLAAHDPDERRRRLVIDVEETGG